MIDGKDFKYLVDNIESVEGLKALYNIALAKQEEKEKRYREIEELIKLLEKEKKGLERYGWCLPVPSIIKRKIADLVVGETEC